MKVWMATLDDLEMIVPLFDAYRVFYGKASDPEGCKKYLRERMSARESYIFLARSDESTPGGFTLLYPSFSSVSMGPVMILNDLYVRAGNRQNGMASALMESAVDFARGQGCLRLHLETANDNIPAQSLYKKKGWIRESGYEHYSLDLA